MSIDPYQLTKNDPYDRTTAIELVVPRLLESREYSLPCRKTASQSGFWGRMDSC